jgi:hypothetical protein
MTSVFRLEQSEASSNLLAHRDEADIAKTTLNKSRCWRLSSESIIDDLSTKQPHRRLWQERPKLQT